MRLRRRRRAVVVLARVLELVVVDVRVLAREEAHLVLAQVVTSNVDKRQPADARRRAPQARVHHLRVQAQALEDLRALVRLESGDAHFGEHLEHTLARRLAVVVGVLFHRLIGREMLLFGTTPHRHKAPHDTDTKHQHTLSQRPPAPTQTSRTRSMPQRQRQQRPIWASCAKVTQLGHATAGASSTCACHKHPHTRNHSERDGPRG